MLQMRKVLTGTHKSKLMHLGSLTFTIILFAFFCEWRITVLDLSFKQWLWVLAHAPKCFEAVFSHGIWKTCPVVLLDKCSSKCINILLSVVLNHICLCRQSLYCVCMSFNIFAWHLSNSQINGRDENTILN